MSDTEDHEQESASNGEIVNSAGDNGSQDSENNHSDKVNGAKDDAEGDEENGEENGNEKDEENDDGPEEKSDICEVIDEAEDSNQSKLDSTGDVITVDDKGEDIPSKTVPDTVFFDSVSEEEKKYYEEKSPSQQSLETMSIQCTACWKQVFKQTPCSFHRLLIHVCFLILIILVIFILGHRRGLLNNVLTICR